jgi:hypothetical protein
MKKYDMTMQILKSRTVGELQHDFNSAYPYLKIDILKEMNGRLGSVIRQRLSKQIKLSSAGKLKEGELEVHDAMTVGQLEKAFREQFGINVQVSRKSGPVWLETTVTDSWTLKQQNEHGRELSTPVKREIPDDEPDFDQ